MTDLDMMLPAPITTKSRASKPLTPSFSPISGFVAICGSARLDLGNRVRPLDAQSPWHTGGTSRALLVGFSQESRPCPLTQTSLP
jgi:hypothetical protein